MSYTCEVGERGGVSTVTSLNSKSNTTNLNSKPLIEDPRKTKQNNILHKPHPIDLPDLHK
ncbi:unnamed protein product [Sphenostylis stenocarpa]|uniref:Uncharacterized protein n=1 Tax=Sphenostylis stenocarpa TaxID=92480 RepID=A0AA86SCW4_9FABA|nr:unnamed protein product [Sphenostylis stenocarpa]